MRLPLRMTLLTDTIFGNGLSVPGEEDLSVLRDEDGFPYFRGSTFKGIFREELENLMAWEGRENVDILKRLGNPGKDADEDGKMRFYDFVIPEKVRTRAKLDDPNDVLEAFTYLRVFTALDEDGMAQKGTLRTYRCIRAGISFDGALDCAEEDRQDVEEALGLVKWVGTMRNRGFGKVKIETVANGGEDR